MIFEIVLLSGTVEYAECAQTDGQGHLHKNYGVDDGMFYILAWDEMFNGVVLPARWIVAYPLTSISRLRILSKEEELTCNPLVLLR